MTQQKAPDSRYATIQKNWNGMSAEKDRQLHTKIQNLQIWGSMKLIQVAPKQIFF